MGHTDTQHSVMSTMMGQHFIKMQGWWTRGWIVYKLTEGILGGSQQKEEDIKYLGINHVLDTSCVSALILTVSSGMYITD